MGIEAVSKFETASIQEVLNIFFDHDILSVCNGWMNLSIGARPVHQRISRVA
jgi:hypothetical protein